ncbi:MAG: hypothetical protein VX672_03525 [Planctomycetota bacterium]|nr:hypothetical protein [Planctomycetota bacterium]
MIQTQARCLPPAGAVSHSTETNDPTVANSCPYIDRNDCRCATRFSLGRLAQMFEICLGPGMAGCFMYHRLRQEDRRAKSPGPDRLVTPTHDGQPVRLRPTGS